MLERLLLDELDDEDRELRELLDELDEDRELLELLDELDDEDRELLELLDELDDEDRELLELLGELDEDRDLLELLGELDDDCELLLVPGELKPADDPARPVWLRPLLVPAASRAEGDVGLLPAQPIIMPLAVTSVAPPDSRIRKLRRLGAAVSPAPRGSFRSVVSDTAHLTKVNGSQGIYATTRRPGIAKSHR